jgi:ABC-type transport system involved in cytochrome bd biosynthesis fused ATPase/permease subunit
VNGILLGLLAIGGFALAVVVGIFVFANQRLQTRLPQSRHAMTALATVGLFIGFALWTALVGGANQLTGTVLFVLAIAIFRLMNHFEPPPNDALPPPPVVDEQPT